MKTRDIPLLIAVALVVALLGACTPSPPDTSPTATSTEATAPFDDALRAQVKAAVTEAFDANGATSWMLLVSQPGRGEMFFQSGDTGRDRNWRIGSVSKTFTGISILRLAERGKLSLDDPLSKYISGIANGNKITIRQLLAMRAGVYDVTGVNAFSTAYAADPAMPWTVTQTIDLIRKGKPGYAPGTETVYDNSDFLLLGRIIEKVTGKSAAKVIAGEAISPAGLGHTIIPVGDTVPPPAVAGNYIAADGTLRQVPRQNPRIPFTAGNMISRIDDLVVWSRALANGSLLEPGYFEQQKQFTQLNAAGLDYGLGLMRWDGWLGHNGFIWGYSNIMMTDPSTGATIIAMNTGGTAANPAPAEAMIAVTTLVWPGAYPQIDALQDKVKSAASSSPS